VRGSFSELVAVKASPEQVGKQAKSTDNARDLAVADVPQLRHWMVFNNHCYFSEE